MRVLRVPQLNLILFRGREMNLGTALGQLLHHHRNIPSGPHAISEKSNDGMRSPSHDSVGMEAEKKIGSAEQLLNGAKGWIWWGKPMWHDMGYLAVCFSFSTSL